ncbi:MAG: fluoride efflux transporter CrcB [Panacagrimonas sp.]
MTPSIALAVAVGGAVGSLARYGVGQAARAFAPGWPWGTLLVNVLGSFAIGLLFAWFAARPAAEWLRLGLITGVLGGFTTFSAFSIETLELLRSDGSGAAIAYIAATLLTGLAACALGLWTARMMLA